MPAPSLRRTIYEFLWSAPLRPLLHRVPVVRRVYDGWMRHHPYDLAHGIDASGYVPAEDCASGGVGAAQINPYGGSQPSILRSVLASLPDVDQYCFVDIGCGKGRPLAVASERPFRRIVGVELSPSLAKVAQANAAAIAARFPLRTAIEIQVADATTVSPPGERVVYFLYNSFGRQLVEALVANVERQLQGPVQHAFFVFFNPVYGDVLDRSPHFARWDARTIPYADDELGYGPDLEDPIVVWQSTPARYPALPGCDRRIDVQHSMRCSLA